MDLRTENTKVNISPATAYGISPLLKTMRPKQWTKNLVVFAGVIFSQKMFENGYFLKAFYAFLTFCFLSGAVYLINDLLDIKKDQAHPTKKYRPLASGQLKVYHAAIAAVIITLLSLGEAFYLDQRFGIVALIYFLITMGYSFKLKNIVIIDVIVIAFGFTLRAIAGTVVIASGLSPWLLVCTFLLALFLGLTKRRAELALLDEKAQEHRQILDEYQPEMLDQMISVATSSTVMAYSLYTFTSGHSIYLMGTIPFVIYGIFRYQYLVHRKDIGGSPEMALLKDGPMIINIVLWIITSSLILYIFV